MGYHKVSRQTKVAFSVYIDLSRLLLSKKKKRGGGSKYNLIFLFKFIHVPIKCKTTNAAI